MIIKEQLPVVIAGYPKSGNTWLTRLVAELLGCAVKGFWGQPKNIEMAIEGGDRSSRHIVYKAHQQYGAFSKYKENIKIIYIVRDVRDIAVSGSNYFVFPPNDFLTKILYCGYPIKKLRRNIMTFHNSRRGHSLSDAEKLDEMIQLLIHGNRYVVSWCKVPWGDHVNGYLGEDVHFVRYEDLLLDPTEECQKVLRFLNVRKSNEHIETAIYNQSFEVVKKKFQKQGDKSRSTFLRNGKSEVWRTRLTCQQQSSLWTVYEDLLKQLKYPEN